MKTFLSRIKLFKKSILALAVSAAVYFILDYFGVRQIKCYIWAAVPMCIHWLLFLIAFYVFRRKQKMADRDWENYVRVYGNKKGQIPANIRHRHAELIKQGKKIPLMRKT